MEKYMLIKTNETAGKLQIFFNVVYDPMLKLDKINVLGTTRITTKLLLEFIENIKVFSLIFKNHLLLKLISTNKNYLN